MSENKCIYCGRSNLFNKGALTASNKFVCWKCLKIVPDKKKVNSNDA